MRPWNAAGGAVHRPGTFHQSEVGQPRAALQRSAAQRPRRTGVWKCFRDVLATDERDEQAPQLAVYP